VEPAQERVMWAANMTPCALDAGPGAIGFSVCPAGFNLALDWFFLAIRLFLVWNGNVYYFWE
jgi:hypothetical protein